MTILGRRQQQGVFSILANANRFGGASGAGSGLNNVMQLLGSGSNFNAAYNTSSTTDVIPPGLTATFTPPRTCFVLILATITASVSTIGAGNYAYGSLYIDGVLQGHGAGRVVALWDKANGGYTTNALMELVSMSPTSHTVDLRIHVDNAAMTYNHYQGLFEVFQLGG